MINFLNWLDGVLWGIPLIVLMLATGIYFTVRSGFFQFTHFGWIMKNTVGQIFHGTADKNESGKGMLHPFETIATAIGGTVGFGNIAGVATAVAAGGPGAVFWMWLTAALGMILKQVEVTLGCYYRHTQEEGAPLGQAVADPGHHLRHRHLQHLLCHFFHPDGFSGRGGCVPSGQHPHRLP